MLPAARKLSPPRSNCSLTRNKPQRFVSPWAVSSRRKSTRLKASSISSPCPRWPPCWKKVRPTCRSMPCPCSSTTWQRWRFGSRSHAIKTLKASKWPLQKAISAVRLTRMRFRSAMARLTRKTAFSLAHKQALMRPTSCETFVDRTFWFILLHTIPLQRHSGSTPN